MSHRTPSRIRLLAGSTLVLALALGLLPAGSALGAPRQPPPPANPPAAIEDLASYTPAISCSPAARRGTVKLARLLTDTYPGTTAGTGRNCGASANSEHHEGRAVDWMVSVRNARQRSEARAVLSWLLATDGQQNQYAVARRLGVMYLIWDNRIWSASRSDEGWRPYNDCARRTEKSADSFCHRNHIHLSLSWEGARGVTSYWTGKVARPDYGPCRPADLNWAVPWRRANPEPCPWYPRVNPPEGASPTLKTLTTYSGRNLRRGSTGSAVKALQRVLGVRPIGTFGPKTEQALRGWQPQHGLDPSGVVGPATWRALLRSQGG